MVESKENMDFNNQMVWSQSVALGKAVEGPQFKPVKKGKGINAADCFILEDDLQVNDF